MDAEYNQPTVNISCDICANPPPENNAYAWMVNGSVIVNQVRGVFFIGKMQNVDKQNIKYTGTAPLLQLLNSILFHLE